MEKDERESEQKKKLFEKKLKRRTKIIKNKKNSYRKIQMN